MFPTAHPHTSPDWRHTFFPLSVMAVMNKTKLLNEIETKIQSLNLLMSTLKADRSRKPGAVEEFRKQYHDLLKSKGKD